MGEFSLRDGGSGGRRAVVVVVIVVSTVFAGVPSSSGPPWMCSNRPDEALRLFFSKSDVVPG